MENNQLRKITVKNPLVELDGDEMAHVIWNLVKQKLVLPFVDINLRTFNLSIENRNDTDDQVTQFALAALREIKVGIKCATVAPDSSRVKEFSLKKMWVSPNATIRRELHGTMFREPIMIKNVHRYIPQWTQPIIVCRQATGDQYDGLDLKIDAETSAGFALIDKVSGQTTIHDVTNFSDQGGVIVGAFNSRENVEQFAVACFEMAVDRKMPLFLSTKNTILKTYDGFIVDTFQRIYGERFQSAFSHAGIFYEHRAIDDMAAYILKSSGGFIWACKNADGDIFTGLISQGFGSLGLMTSELHAPGGIYLSDHAHGTITRHFREHQQGRETSTNPVAIIFAWSRGLKRRGLLDNNQELVEFAEKMERASIETVESGTATRDLAAMISGGQVPRESYVTTEEFIDRVESKLKQLASQATFV